jgi:ABC-2 type transport system permease protein
MDDIMGNVLNIARKEFADFMGSKFILFVTLVFLATFIFNLSSVYNSYQYDSGWSLIGYTQYSIHSGLDESELLSTLQDALCNILLTFGGVIALLMGYLAISNERRNHALTTVIAKPLFRDTIINGKLIGATTFLVALFVFISAVYTIGIIAIIGNTFSSIAYEYLASIPLIIILSWLCVMIYYSISLLVSLFIKNDTLALFVSVLTWLIITQELSTWDIAMYIAAFFGQSQLSVISTIIRICPNNLVTLSILNYNDFNNVGLVDSVMNNGISVIALILYLFILTVVSYTVFLRRDIS